ncbi:MAG: GNAT family N-acetyltransferase [Oscillospiraceae bacterium]|nr:GNAT family N-acetyltransferase [Oscillospiraceae bacterium]
MLASMIKLSGLTGEQVHEISCRIADTFYDYKYSEDDLGLIKYIRSREDMRAYMEAIIQASYNSGLLYTTSEKQEGFLVLSGDGVGSIGFADGMKMIFAEKKALGGLKNMKSFIRACFAEGNTIETRMRKAKRKFIRIEVLVVRPEYQKQGYMRRMMEYVYALADERGLPVILDTDDKDKSLRYQHLGMTLDRVRNCGEKFHMYDLMREAGAALK